MNFLKLMLLPGFLFLMIFGFGLWVSNVGIPNYSMLLNLHKLIALGAVILAAIRIFKLDPFKTFPNLAMLLIALAVLSVIGSFTTGAVMSIEDELPKTAQMVHRIHPAVVLISMLISVYLGTMEELKM